MKQYKASYVIIVILLLIVAGCSTHKDTLLEYQPVQEKRFQSSVSHNAVDITDSGYTEVFQDPDYYGMDNLENHHLIQENDTLQAEFYFNEQAKLDEINRARSFVITKFVMWKESKFGGLPYDELVKLTSLPKNIYCKIYLDHQLLLQDSYQGDELVLYENLSVPFLEREIADQTINLLTEKIRKVQKDSQITYQKSLLGSCFIVNIQTEKEINEIQLTQIKEHLLNLIEQDLDKNSGKRKQNLSVYRGIVLRLTLPNKNQYEETYVNISNSPRWIKDDWMNFPFLAELY